jgi:DNA-binding response OmpR family regulator
MQCLSTSPWRAGERSEPMTKKILVIDDEYDIVELEKAILKTKGYNILVAYDGEEGWQRLMDEKPDLVVVDLRMPKMSGVEFCRKIRRTPEVANTPVLVVSSITAGADKPDEFWAAGLGSDDFLPKPFDPLSLLGKVEYLLRKGEYVSDLPSRSPRAPVEEPPPKNATKPRRGDSPAEVVRIFVESWNTKNFSAEYDSLGDEMLGEVTREEYVQRRAQLYADENGDRITQHVLDTDVKISRNVAAVACLREDSVNGAPRRKDERYTLKKTTEGWKIVGMKSRPLTFTIE